MLGCPRRGMTARSGTTVKSMTIIALMILTAMVPLVNTSNNPIVAEEHSFEPQSLELGERISFNTGGRAPCPSVQNDGGTTGDAANTTNTTKTFGTDPSSQNVPGCVDATDTLDFFSVTLTAGKDYTVELTVPTGADFDLYLVDSNVTILESSEYNDPLESITFITNSSNAGTYYVAVAQYTSDGGYSLDMWTNTSAARPDLTVSSVSGPSTASAGSTVSVSYTVNNIGLAALNSSTPYDIPIILSTDTIYDATDTILNVQISGPNLASGASQQMSSNVPIPSSLSAGNYYWIVWADGWDNVTESNDLNNNNYSSSTTAISSTSTGGDILEPNDSTANATITGALPFAYNNLSIHTTTDDDYFEVTLISGITYWFNATFTHANGDLDMDLISGTTQLDYSGSGSDNEYINYTATSNQTAHLYVYGYMGDTNTYQLSIESSTPTTPSRNESIYAIINDHTQWESLLFGLTTGTNYSILWELWWFNGTALQPVGQSWDNFTANSSFYNPVRSFNGELFEGEWYVDATLYDNSGSSLLYLDANSDYIYIEKMNGTVISDILGMYTAQNLTIGNMYEINWWILEGSLASGNYSTIDSGTTGYFNATTTTLSNYVSWNLPSNSTQHEFLVRLIDSNGYWHGENSVYFTPSLPDVVITNVTTYNSSISTTNYVYATLSNLSVGDDYGYDLEMTYYPNFPYSVGSSTYFTSSYYNTTATNSTMFGWISFTTPSVSGWYCAIFSIYDDLTGSGLSGYQYCFTIVYDDDIDGVWNEDDLCPNTSANSTVDANGCAAYQRDSDSDGYNDAIDAFPFDATQWSDADGDGYGDNAWGNNPDAFINDASQWSDTDGDGYGDNPNGTTPDGCPNVAGTSVWDQYGCPDYDGDGWSDAGDDFINDSTQWSDTDGDGYGDNPNGNMSDAFPTDSTQWVDADGDGYGDNPQGNNSDVFPTDATQWFDSDGDGYGDNPLGNNPDACPNSPPGAIVDSNGCADSERDSDGDGVFDSDDDCVNIDASGWDTDGDGCIDDSDDDGVLDPDDNCRFTDATGWDTDGDGCIDDTDGDGVLDPDDDCRMVDSTGFDNDGDGCIDDTDGDNVNDANDACAFENASGWDTDGDGCIDDTDGDSIKDDVDQCRNVDSTGWDTDGDGCIDDSDDDGVPDNADQCRYASSQGFDMNGDGCLDDSDGDLVLDNMDNCRFENATGYDANGDGCIDDTDGDGVKDTLDQCSEDASGFDADGDGCIDDTDGDAIKDNVDDCVDEDATGFDVDENGCIDDSDGDGVKDNVDACVDEDATGFDIDENGCIDDSDGDGVKDNVDVCANEDATGYDVDGNGCIDDTDGDGVNDANDAFPEDPVEIEDSDGDGVGDVADAYPMDASRSAEEGSLSMPFWIALVIIVMIAIAGSALFLMRKLGSDEDGYEGAFASELAPAEDIYAMAGIDAAAATNVTQSESDATMQSTGAMAPAHATLNEHGQKTWVDEVGNTWCQNPDGSMMRFDTESGAWVPHQ